MKKWIFRKIGGRIVRMVLKKGATTEETLKSSAAIRTALKAKIDAKRSLSTKRMAAVRAVMEVNKGRGWRLGEGIELKAFEKGELVVKQGRTTISQVFDRGKQIDLIGEERIAQRALIDIAGSKHKFTPETFKIQTSGRSYLVQQRAIIPLKFKNMRDYVETPTHVISKSMARGRKLVDRAKRFGYDISPDDVYGENIGKIGRRWVIIDPGMAYEPKRMDYLTERLKKFTVSIHSYRKKGPKK